MKVRWTAPAQDYLGARREPAAEYDFPDGAAQDAIRDGLAAVPSLTPKTPTKPAGPPPATDEE